MWDQDLDQTSTPEAERAGAQLDVPAPRSPSAARLLEMTARETDQWRADARAEADAIIAAAREEAAGLVQAAQRDADSVRADARRAAEQTVADAEAAAAEVRSGVEERRAREEAHLAGLEQVAAEHSAHLRAHLSDVLGRLDALASPNGNGGSSH